MSHTAELGGAEIALLRLADAIDRDAFELIACLCAGGPFERELIARGIRVCRMEAEGLERRTRADARSAWTMLRSIPTTQRLARRLRTVIARERADLVVANSLKAAIMTAIAAPMARRPWVWHLHDRLTSDYLPLPLAGCLRAIALIGPRRIVANSRATAATVRSLRRGGVVVAYPGIVGSGFDVPGADGHDGAIGMVGRISATKGQREFLDAIRVLAARGRRQTYRIIGAALFEDGPFEQRLREHAQRFPELRAVEWTGWQQDVNSQLRRLRLLVHASPLPEPFGQVVVEAMAAGVPVVAAHAGGIPEIVAPDGVMTVIAPGVTRGTCGLLVRPGDPRALADAIGWALDNSETMSAGAERARRLARGRFTIEETARIVEEAWRHAWT